MFVEEGFLAGTLPFHCGHSYAQEEYAVKRETDNTGS